MTAQTKLPLYMPYPRFLLHEDLTQTAKLLYSLLLDRATLSQKNSFTDEQGRLYIIYPIEKLSCAIDRSHMTVKNSLNELEAAGLIERKRQGFSVPNRIYVKIPDGQETVSMTDRNLSLIGKENYPSDRQKTVSVTDRKLSPNNKSNNNKKYNDLMGASEARTAYGQYMNVFLSTEEYGELQAEYPNRLDRFIEEMSRYLAANGKTYDNYAAALRIWADNDKKDTPKQSITTLTCKEGTSL